MKAGWHPIQFLLGYLSSNYHQALREAHEEIAYLREEAAILRSRCGRRVLLTEPEKARLVRFAMPVRSRLRHLVCIVKPQTLLKWIREAENPSPKPPPVRRGRPPTPIEIIALVVRIARENLLKGTESIRGELMKLGIALSERTIGRILRKHKVEPAPSRGKSNWGEFIRRNMDSLWAADFMEVRTLSMHGLVTWHVLVFIHLGSRKLWVAGATRHPDSAWVEEQGGRFVLMTAETGMEAEYLILDRDTKFTRRFRNTLAEEGTTVVLTRYQTPVMNTFAERMIWTLRHECLNHFIIMGEKHLRFLLSEFQCFYNTYRCHQGRGNVPIDPRQRGPDILGKKAPSNVVAMPFLGGLHHHYYASDSLDKAA